MGGGGGGCGGVCVFVGVVMGGFVGGPGEVGGELWGWGDIVYPSVYTLSCCILQLFLRFVAFWEWGGRYM